MMSLDDAFDDFGFSAVSDEDLKRVEQDLREEVASKNKMLATLEKQATQQQQKAERMAKLIMPLLANLKKNPEKDYIHWPNRVEKIDGFIDKIAALLDE